MSAATPVFDPEDPAHQRAFESQGYVCLPGMVPADRLAALTASILGTFDAARGGGALFNGGGLISGHLNCFPGAESRFVFDTLVERGVIDLVRKLMPQATGLPNVGCNLNLPGSNPQNRHIDGYAADAFAIVNIACVDTTLENGAMEILPGTNRRAYKYWELVVENPQPLRPVMKRGDVMIRTSALWHRGMPNPSATPRPMLALTWEDGGSKIPDPWAKENGKISFYPNRYEPTRLGRLRERAFVAVPSVNLTLRFVRSLLLER